MKVTIFDSQTTLQLNKGAITKLVKALLLNLKISYHEIIFHFVDEKTICELHDKYFNDNTPTDCITFPIDDENELNYRIIGEIFICSDVALQYALKHSINAFDEICLYIVHGILHLIGYDDILEEDKIIMKKKEKACMDFLRQNNLILT